MKKTILGLDLGTNFIGCGLVKNLGSHILLMIEAEIAKFESGVKILK